jgi:fructokinase
MNNPLHPFGIFGEVLFDCFPDGSWVMGGAPLNVAWHLQAFAQAPLFISRIGPDEAATAICTDMRNWGLDTQGLQIDGEYPTGQVTVSFTDQQPSYSILDQQAYDYIEAEELPALNFDILYHGSLALRNPDSLAALAALKARRPGKVFMDVNLREPWWSMDSVSSWMADADWLKLNDAEFAQLQPGDDTLEQRLRQFKQRYQLEGLILTQGSAGAMAIGPDQQLITVQPDSASQIIDTVGAGDAFAAVILLGIRLDWDLALTMQRAQDFASALVGQRGATVQDKAFYQTFIEEWC